MGLEALSRGAASAVFIDHYTQQLIRQNAALCGFADCVEVLRLNSAKALARLQGRKFDYIFADPPYNKNLVNDTIALIGEYDLLAPGGLILMEYSRNEGITESPLYEVIRENPMGKTRGSLLSAVVRKESKKCESVFVPAVLILSPMDTLTF